MELGRLFVHTLGDLEQRIESTDEYTVLMAAALLRKLLLDQGHLLAQVNSKYKLSIYFRISDVSPFEQMIYNQEPEFWGVVDALDPDGPFAYRPYGAKLDQFIARRVLRFGGHWLTVGDVISYLANVAGAVHSGKPRNERQRALHEVEQFYSRAGLSGGLSQIKLVGRITVHGLHPLRDAVVADGSATWALVDSDHSVELAKENKEFIEKRDSSTTSDGVNEREQ